MGGASRISQISSRPKEMDRSVLSCSLGIILWVALTLVSGCVPSTLTTYKTSAERSSDVVSHDVFNGLILDLPGDVRLWVYPPSRLNADTMTITVEIPAGHTARFSKE